MVEAGMDVWRSSGPTSLLKQDHLEKVDQGNVQIFSFWIFGMQEKEMTWIFAAIFFKIYFNAITMMLL